ncbi:hypothetical protein [Nocardia colli]|uniref:hypothetical protein n=1 Tax=Nocardia colli TaxID=2545717 RepID=UPI0035D7C6B2
MSWPWLDWRNELGRHIGSAAAPRPVQQCWLGYAPAAEADIAYSVFSWGSSRSGIPRSPPSWNRSTKPSSNTSTGGRNGFQLSYGNQAFDAAVRKALAQHHSDPAALWHALEAAMAHWQPRTPDRIAPVALLADPALAYSLTPERGRALLRQPRSGR